MEFCGCISLTYLILSNAIDVRQCYEYLRFYQKHFVRFGIEKEVGHFKHFSMHMRRSQTFGGATNCFHLLSIGRDFLFCLRITCTHRELDKLSDSNLLRCSCWRSHYHLSSAAQKPNKQMTKKEEEEEDPVKKNVNK